MTPDLDIKSSVYSRHPLVVKTWKVYVFRCKTCSMHACFEAGKLAQCCHSHLHRHCMLPNWVHLWPLEVSPFFCISFADEVICIQFNMLCFYLNMFYSLCVEWLFMQWSTDSKNIGKCVRDAQMSQNAVEKCTVLKLNCVLTYTTFWAQQIGLEVFSHMSIDLTWNAFLHMSRFKCFNSYRVGCSLTSHMTFNDG